MLTTRSLALAATVLSSALAAQADWNQLSPPNTPQGRGGHAMAYDIVHDQIVLFGGNVSGMGFMNDTWTYDGATWTQVFPSTVPPARAGHPMAYDVARQKIVMFGGIPIGGGALADTWEWDGATQDWTQVFPATNPPAKRSQPLIYHPIRQTCVMWGGYNGSADVNDTWEYNGVDWSQIVTQNAPSGRRASDMAFDPSTGGILLFSGYQRGADTWLFDNVDWRLLTPATVPPQRYDHTMIHDLLRGRVVMFGGNSLGDTWEWDGGDWIQRLPNTSPPARYDDYLIWDDIRQRVVMFGGLQGNPDMWEYRTTAPAQFTPFGSGCSGTSGSAPDLGTTDRPWLGESFDVLVSQVPATSPVFMLVGFSNTTWNGLPLPVSLSGIGMTGCDLLIDPIVGYGITNSGGTAVATLALPMQANLIGRSMYYQAMAVDAGANRLGVTVSNGGDALMGVK